MNERPTIVCVLYSGRDFTFQDVELLARHINGKWKGEVHPRIICLWDKASEYYNLGNIELIPLHTSPGIIGTWSRIWLYSPAMEQYKPFLYIDLDTAIINSLENIFTLVKDLSQFIALEDFWQKGQVATGLVWFPKDCKITQDIYKRFVQPTGPRMDSFIRKLCGVTTFWQSLTNTIQDFKPQGGQLLNKVPAGTDLVCFHGKPRILQAAETISWVKKYVEAIYKVSKLNKKVTVIIPYKTDRGWLMDAVNSVPEGVQLILSQGNENWPENFNKALSQATGDYIRWLHEDDMLTPNCIEDSVRAIEEQGVDFIHGNATEIFSTSERQIFYRPRIQKPTWQDLMKKNVIHSATLMYRKEVFQKVGNMNESLNTEEEYEFNLRCLKSGLKIGYCNSNLAIYRKHPLQKVKVVPVAMRMKEKEMVNSLYR
jgi:Glycosyl transferase family 2